MAIIYLYPFLCFQQGLKLRTIIDRGRGACSLLILESHKVRAGEGLGGHPAHRPCLICGETEAQMGESYHEPLDTGDRAPSRLVLVPAPMECPFYWGRLV